MKPYRLKRPMDIVLSIFLLIATLPFFCIAFCLAAMDGHFPFFLQRRVGMHGKEFTIYKFRTMKSPASSSASKDILPDAPELTPIGRFLRNTSMDELPQLINVLKGEMSLVGPRPHPPSHIERYVAIDPRYERRYDMLPGIVGLVQVTSLRYLTHANAHIRMRVSSDLYYIRNCSLGLDCKILYKTLQCVLIPRFAYRTHRQPTDDHTSLFSEANVHKPTHSN